MAEEKKEEKKEKVKGKKEDASLDDKNFSEEEFSKLEKKHEDIIEKIEKMSVLELSELVKVLEDKFGVSAQQVVGVAASPGTSSAEGEASGTEEEKSEFNIELTEVGDQKIQVIKAVREITQKGLKEAKDLVDAAPKVITENIAKNEAEEIKKKLEETGATVALK